MNFNRPSASLSYVLNKRYTSSLFSRIPNLLRLSSNYLIERCPTRFLSNIRKPSNRLNSEFNARLFFFSSNFRSISAYYFKIWTNSVSIFSFFWFSADISILTYCGYSFLLLSILKGMFFVNYSFSMIFFFGIEYDFFAVTSFYPIIFSLFLAVSYCLVILYAICSFYFFWGVFN